MKIWLFIFLSAISVIAEPPAPPFPTNAVVTSHIARRPPPATLLSWTPSLSPNVVGYNIYQGSVSGEYTNEISVGNVTNVTITNSNLGQKYYYAGAAVNAQGIQSALSAETSFQQRTSYLVQTWIVLGQSTDCINWTSNVICEATNARQFFRLGWMTAKTPLP